MPEVSGLTANTAQRLQLNAGVFLENFTVATSVTDAATFKTALDAAITAGTGLLGATRGGGTFVATPETREPDIDGKRYRVKGMTLVDSWDVRLTGTLVECYAGNFKRVLGSADVTTPSGGHVDTLTLRTAIANTDYIDKLAWISLMGDGTYMMIELDNVINLDGMTFTFQDKNEGTIPFNFAACQSGLDSSAAPFRIKYFHPSTTPNGGGGGSGGSGGSGDSQGS